FNIAFGGSQDNGTVMFSGNQGWTFVDFGDGGLVHIDPVNPNNVYHVLNGALFGSSTGGGLNSYTNLLDVNDIVGGLYFPFLIDPINTDRLLVGGSPSLGVQETLDRGNSWISLGGLDNATGLAAATYQGDFATDPNNPSAADPSFPLVADKG